MLGQASVDELCDRYALGSGRLSPAPVARGRLGAVWRLDATSGAWAVKTNDHPTSEDEVADGSAYQEAAVGSGVSAPGVRRTREGRVLAEVGGIQVRVLRWTDLDPPDPGLDPSGVGALVAGLHRVEWAPARPLPPVDPWFAAPVGGSAWDDLLAQLVARRAPFADELGAHRSELVALEALLHQPVGVRWCHRDLFADNVRSTPGGSFAVFDFDNSGPAGVDQELAFVLVEFATTPAPGNAGVDADRARRLLDAYRSAGGPGRLTGPRDFAMVVAVIGHLAEHASMRWLAAPDDATRADMAGWVRELTDRPLTRQVIADLLDAGAR